jgi:hypothetical protein
MVIASLACGSSVQPAGAMEPRNACSKPAFRLQFWPTGTSGNPRPHLVVYPGSHGRTRQQDRIGYADVTQLRDAFVCGQDADFAPRVKQMRGKVRATSAVQLVCRPGLVRGFGLPRFTPSGATTQSFGMVEVRGADRRVLYAQFNPNQLSPGGGPVLQYDSRVCTARRIKCANVSPPCRLSEDGVSTQAEAD